MFEFSMWKSREEGRALIQGSGEWKFDVVVDWKLVFDREGRKEVGGNNKANWFRVPRKDCFLKRRAPRHAEITIPFVGSI